MLSKLSTLLFLLVSTNVLAKPINLPDVQENRQPKEENSFKLGLMGAYVSEIYKEADPTIVPFPLILAKWNDFYFEGVTGGYEYKNEGFVFRAFGKFDSSFAYDGDTSDFLKGMENRDPGVNLGARFSYTFQNFHTIQADVEQNITDASDGLVAKLKYQYLWMISPKIVNISGVGGKIYDKKYLSYYLDLDKANRDNPTNAALNSINDYNITSSAANLYLENTTYIVINKKWSFMTFISYEKFSDEIKNSPIVDKSGRLTFLAGPIYSF